jgi:hypothetical protein
MGHDYKIVWEPRNGILLKAEVDGVPGELRCHGLCDEENQTIRIEKTLPPTFEREVLIHETLHQIFSTSGFELDAESEERFVSYLGAALAAHICDNPTFWRYATRHIK